MGIAAQYQSAFEKDIFNHSVMAFRRCSSTFANVVGINVG
jgi:hypothetical protein